MFRLWGKLRNPPAHNPLYTRFYHQQKPTHARAGTFVFGGIAGMFILSGGVMVLPLFFPLLSPVMGGVWAYGVAGNLRDKFTPCMPLVAVSPGGVRGSIQHVMLGVIHRNGRFNELVGPQMGTLRMFAAFFMALPLVWVFVLDPVEEIPIAVLLLLYAVGVAFVWAGLWFVHIYCMLAGVLAGMIASTFRFSVFVVQLGAVLVYIVTSALVILLVITASGFVFVWTVGQAAQVGEVAMLLTIMLNGALTLLIATIIVEGTVRALNALLTLRLEVINGR